MCGGSKTQASCGKGHQNNRSYSVHLIVSLLLCRNRREFWEKTGEVKKKTVSGYERPRTGAGWNLYSAVISSLALSSGVAVYGSAIVAWGDGLLQAWGRGDEQALQQLIPLVYDQLHAAARRYMAGERPGHTLQTTALIHETYLRLVDVRKIQWQNRAHFFAICAKLMRRILIDFARSRDYQKRGAGTPHINLDDALVLTSPADANLLLMKPLTGWRRWMSGKAAWLNCDFSAGLV
jgi:RNA polymerase sigma factor (TIGR02999 family)